MRRIRVLDLQGRVVLEEDRVSAVHRNAPRLLALEPSVYLVEVNTPEGWVRRKWVKQLRFVSSYHKACLSRVGEAELFWYLGVH